MIDLFNMHHQLRLLPYSLKKHQELLVFLKKCAFFYSPPMDPNVKGIPNFWLTIFKNVSKLSEMVQDHDEPILKSLQDIKGN